MTDWMGPIVWKITKPGLFLYYLNVTANHFVRILVLIFSVEGLHEFTKLRLIQTRLRVVFCIH